MPQAPRRMRRLGEVHVVPVGEAVAPAPAEPVELDVTEWKLTARYQGLEPAQEQRTVGFGEDRYPAPGRLREHPRPAVPGPRAKVKAGLLEADEPPGFGGPWRSGDKRVRGSPEAPAGG